jgi:hypothetical protein
MTPIEEVIVAINAVNALMAFGSVFVNLWAARDGLLRFRAVHASVASLAFLYALLYGWLLIFDPPLRLWSSIGRGLSLTAWPIVWVLPAVVSIRATHELHQAIQRHQEGDL